MKNLQKKLKQFADPKRAKLNASFFKTGKGEYGEGDIFLGIRMPDIRKVAKEFSDIKAVDLKKIIKSKYHEERMLGLIILTNQFKQAQKEQDEKRQDQIYQSYLAHFKYINNWDLIDVTCPHIVGAYLYRRDRKIIYEWAKSPRLWTRRVAVLATFYFIRQGDLEDIFKIAKMLLKDEHDLIHKAVGWMLREAGKKNIKLLYAFLDQHALQMPRTMLRYSIEKLPERKRQFYLKKKT